MKALQQTHMKRLVVAGGVGANRLLRETLNQQCAKKGIRVHYPELEWCSDNGAMIAMAAAMRLQKDPSQALIDLNCEVRPRWPLADVSI